MRIGTVIAVAAGAMLAGCGSGVVIPPSMATASDPGVLSVEVLNLDVASDEFDIRLMMNNLSDQPIIVILSDIRCFRGERMVSVKYGNFGIGERTIDFQPRESKPLTFVCEHGPVQSETFGVLVHKVYSNPEWDGRTRGEPFPNEITWSFTRQ